MLVLVRYAKYVDVCMQGNFTWAMAGRNRAKMEEMKTWLAEDGKSLAEVDMIEANVADQASIDKLAAESSVVITAVGPYALYGRPVVKVRFALRTSTKFWFSGSKTPGLAAAFFGAVG